MTSVWSLLFLACLTLASAISAVKDDRSKVPLVRRAEPFRSDRLEEYDEAPGAMTETEEEFVEPRIELNETQRSLMQLRVKQLTAAGFRVSTSEEYRRRRVLNPGAIVALYSSSHQRYIRANGAVLDTSSVVADGNQLRDSWTWERFTVIAAPRRRGAVALHSPVHNRFMKMNGESMTMSPVTEDYDLPWNWEGERFEEKELLGNVALWNPQFQRFVRMRGHSLMDGSGVMPIIDNIPGWWTWERFVVIENNVNDYIQPGDVVALHNSVHNRFVRLNNGISDSSAASNWNQLPDSWTWERFTVVDAGEGSIALYSKHWKKFLKFGGAVSPVAEMNELPSGWWGEKWSIVNAGEGNIALWNSWCACFLRMNGAKIDSSPPGSTPETLSDSWTWERFRVVKLGEDPLVMIEMSGKKDSLTEMSEKKDRPAKDAAGTKDTDAQAHDKAAKAK